MKYPIGIQDFESLRRDGYAYVDKTALVYKLASEGRYYFLSRPRRFGKSLLISTMEAYFSGKKELFEGLAMMELEKEWKQYPILHLDLNTGKYDSAEALNEVLNFHVSRWEKEYGSEASEQTLALRFKGIIERACRKCNAPVVILVDEYDKPLLQNIGNEALQDEMRSILKAFYSNLKTQDRYIKFGFLTGVTKFSKVSVFSDLNNLNDISMDRRYHDICGMTRAEIETNFDEGVGLLAVSKGMSKEACYEELTRRYDGYHFTSNTNGIYNPFSVLNTLSKGEFGSYWFETGTPTFLIELLKNNHYPLKKLTEEEVGAEDLGSVDSMLTNPIPIIYQSGYLTIKGYDEEFGMYKLGFPNEEVEEGFVKKLIPLYVNNAGEGMPFISKFVKGVRAGDVDGFMTLLQEFLEGGDYRVAGDKELYFQNVMFLIFRMAGFYTQVELATARGRIDVTIETKDYVYVMELKLDKSAEEALRQIEEKGYADKFKGDSREVVKIGVEFSGETRSVKEWVVSY